MADQQRSPISASARPAISVPRQLLEFAKCGFDLIIGEMELISISSRWFGKKRFPAYCSPANMSHSLNQQKMERDSSHDIRTRVATGPIAIDKLCSNFIPRRVV